VVKSDNATEPYLRLPERRELTLAEQPYRSPAPSPFDSELTHSLPKLGRLGKLWVSSRINRLILEPRHTQLTKQFTHRPRRCRTV
jgi:hypothetical protein